MEKERGEKKKIDSLRGKENARELECVIINEQMSREYLRKEKQRIKKEICKMW